MLLLVCAALVIVASVTITITVTIIAACVVASDCDDRLEQEHLDVEPG